MALVGDDDPQVTVDEASSWREHTTASFELKVFPGGHFFLDSHVAPVLDLIRGRMSVVPVRS
nr:thioesterase domain-containing protein [Streptomyces brevispora]